MGAGSSVDCNSKCPDCGDNMFHNYGTDDYGYALCSYCFTKKTSSWLRCDDCGAFNEDIRYRSYDHKLWKNWCDDCFDKACSISVKKDMILHDFRNKIKAELNELVENAKWCVQRIESRKCVMRHLDRRILRNDEKIRISTIKHADSGYSHKTAKSLDWWKKRRACRVKRKEKSFAKWGYDYKKTLKYTEHIKDIDKFLSLATIDVESIIDNITACNKPDIFDGLFKS
jgi:hypothetical protein